MLKTSIRVATHCRPSLATPHPHLSNPPAPGGALKGNVFRQKLTAGYQKKIQFVPVMQLRSFAFCLLHTHGGDGSLELLQAGPCLAEQVSPGTWLPSSGVRGAHQMLISPCRASFNRSNERSIP